MTDRDLLSAEKKASPYRYEVVKGDKLLRVFDTHNDSYIASASNGRLNALEQLVSLANQGWQHVGK